MIPERKIKIPEGHEPLQPNKLFNDVAEARSEYGNALIRTWTDVESGKICCLTISKLKTKTK